MLRPPRERGRTSCTSATRGYSTTAPAHRSGTPRALIGVDGVIWDREMADAPPVPIRGIVVGALILAVGVIGWAIGRLWRHK